MARKRRICEAGGLGARIRKIESGPFSNRAKGRESFANDPFAGNVNPGEAVRVFDLRCTAQICADARVNNADASSNHGWKS